MVFKANLNAHNSMINILLIHFCTHQSITNAICTSVGNMVTLHQHTERFLIYIATAFLCAIVLVVPIIIAMVLLAGQSKSGTLDFEQFMPDTEWNFLSFKEAKKKTKIDEYLETERPLELINDIDEKTDQIIKRPPYNMDLAPDCPTCPYMEVSKYFKYSKYGCPDFLNTPECCFCNKAKSKPPKLVEYNKDFMEYKSVTNEKYTMWKYNDTFYQHYYHYERCKTCKMYQKLSWIGDGECDMELDTSECCFDGGDCNEKK